MKRKHSSVSEAMLEEWTRTRKAPHHADWVHQKTMAKLSGKP
jgi:hypothetical protein